MAKCEICGKTRMFGNNVPHSLHKTKRQWRPNIQKIMITRDGQARRAFVCAQCLRTINKAKSE